MIILYALVGVAGAMIALRGVELFFEATEGPDYSEAAGKLLMAFFDVLVGLVVAAGGVYGCSRILTHVFREVPLETLTLLTSIVYLALGLALRWPISLLRAPASRILKMILNRCLTKTA